MEGLAELTAPAKRLAIAGALYWIHPMRAVDWAEAASELNRLRRPPLEIVKQRIEGLPLEAQKHLIELAYRDERDGDLVPIETLKRWFRTPAGRVYRLWLMLRQHPDQHHFKPSDAEALIMQAGSEIEQSERDGEGLPAGNSSGLARQSAATAANRGPGAVSSAS